MKLQPFIEKNLFKRSFLSYLFWPLSIKYSILLKIRRKFYLHFSNYVFRSKCKIISIGNITSGGSGKTPFTIFLAKYLKDINLKVAVSHRGYKGKFEKQNKLISDEKEVFRIAKDAGDEAFLLANKLKGIPVIAGKNRKLSIQRLTQKFSNLDYIILDDSFQHLKVKHDIDFVLFSAIGGIGNGFVLPAGILREPLSSLKYADCIIFNGEGEIPARIKKYNKPIIRGYYQIKRFYNTSDREVSLENLKKRKIALLSAIGLPKSFENTIKENGLNFIKHYHLPDHYDFKDKSVIDYLSEEVRKKEIEYLITTEKDYAKLQFLKDLKLPLLILEIEFKLSEENERILSDCLNLI
jgi:tetraacyldisaccharide 4'-kinase